MINIFKYINTYSNTIATNSNTMATNTAETNRKEFEKTLKILSLSEELSDSKIIYHQLKIQLIKKKKEALIYEFNLQKCKSKLLEQDEDYFNKCLEWVKSSSKSNKWIDDYISHAWINIKTKKWIIFEPENRGESNFMKGNIMCDVEPIEYNPFSGDYHNDWECFDLNSKDIVEGFDITKNAEIIYKDWAELEYQSDRIIKEDDYEDDIDRWENNDKIPTFLENITQILEENNYLNITKLVIFKFN